MSASRFVPRGGWVMRQKKAAAEGDRGGHTGIKRVVRWAFAMCFRFYWSKTGVRCVGTGSRPPTPEAALEWLGGWGVTGTTRGTLHPFRGSMAGRRRALAVPTGELGAQKNEGILTGKKQVSPSNCHRNILAADK